MHRLFAILLLALSAGHASAQTCPPFFRFVDFGLSASYGKIYRGGTLVRAEGLDGRALLLHPQTRCLAITDFAKDGPGNPIPIVTIVAYDPDLTGMSLNQLNLRSVKDSHMTATNNLENHLGNLSAEGAEVTRSADFLCVRTLPENTSCQLTTSYPNLAPLVIYCDAVRCEMPALAIKQNIIVDAMWSIESQQPQSADNIGQTAMARVSAIHAFLGQLSADF